MNYSSTLYDAVETQAVSYNTLLASQNPNSSTFDNVHHYFISDDLREKEKIDERFLSSSYNFKFFSLDKVNLHTARKIIPVQEEYSYNPKKNPQNLKMLSDVKQLSSFENGWNGEYSQAPSRQAIEDAKDFIHLLRDFKIILPYISLANDGEINFCWKDNDFILDLGFYGDKTYSFYLKTTEGKKFHGDEIQVCSNIPQEILDVVLLKK